MFERVTVPTLIALCVGVCSARSSLAAPGRGVSPWVFGKVFRSSRDAMVRVTWTKDQNVYATGFVVGAAGEVIFGTKNAPPEKVAVTTVEGVELAGQVLGFDESLGLAVLRIEGPEKAHPPAIPGGRVSAIAPEQWALVLSFDERKDPVPFAGVVLERPRKRSVGPKSARQRHDVAAIEAPGTVGSPVLSVKGRLVGVVIKSRGRTSDVVTVPSLMPFLKKVVLGE